MNEQIIYEDNHLIVVNKPAGILTQPTHLQEDSLEIQVKEWIKHKYQKPGNVFLGVVHRLDKPVNGIIIFAKTSKALSRLNESFRSKKCKKIYQALVDKNPEPLQGTLEHYLVHGDFQARITTSEEKDAKLARLHYKIIKQESKFSLLEIELETGRYHQIRVQLASIGCPIIGDKRYGSKMPFRPDQIALQHVKLQVEHPISKEIMTFESPNILNF